MAKGTWKKHAELEKKVYDCVPDDSIKTTRQIAKEVDAHWSTVRKILENLESKGMIESIDHERGTRKFKLWMAK